MARSKSVEVVRLDELETRIVRQLGTHDQAIAGILNTLRELTGMPVSKRRPIGFTADLEEKD